MTQLRRSAPIAREAFVAGVRACLARLTAQANPHSDWLLGVAWASGWHWQADELSGGMAEQAALIGLDEALCEDWGRV